MYRVTKMYYENESRFEVLEYNFIGSLKAIKIKDYLPFLKYCRFSKKSANKLAVKLNIENET